MIRAALKLMLGGLVCLVCLASPAPARKPNIVLMLADNLGYGDVGFLGTGGELRGMPTPRIDRLASEGLRFDGVDYSDYFLRKTDEAPRESLITFIRDRIAAVPQPAASYGGDRERMGSAAKQ